MTLTFTESGGNVVMTASGSLNVNDLILVNPTSGPYGGGGLGVTTATFLMGATGQTAAQYSGFTSTPSNFGPGGVGASPSSISGDIFGVIWQGAPPYTLLIPTGYTTGTAISSTQTFDSQTFTSLGLTQGTYTYSWGSGANADSINVVVGGGGVTPTPTATSVTPTPTPTTVTGYGYNLVVLPYQPPTSGNVLFSTFSTPGLGSGTTNPNTFDVNGVLWNFVDNQSVDRTEYYSGMTGNSVTAYFTQNGETVIYSGSSNSFTTGSFSPNTFFYDPQSNPNELILIQSATTNFITGQTVYISYTVNP
jgi:hypothetical protein